MKILAVDFGEARTGLAICDQMEMLSSPVGVIHDHNFQRVVEKTAEACREQRAQEVVVGLPKNMDNTLGERAQRCQDFARQLQKLLEIPVGMWDERSTTVSAIQVLNTTDTRGKKRKNVVDAVAATIILESYLAYRRNHPGATAAPPPPEEPLPGSEA